MPQKMSFTVAGNKVCLTWQGGRAEIEAVTPRMLRVFRAHRARQRPSSAVESLPCEKTNLRVSQDAGRVVIETGALRAVVSDGFLLDIYDAAGAPLCLDARKPAARLSRHLESAQNGSVAAAEGHEEAGGGPQTAFTVRKQLESGVRFYGLGEKTGPLNKRGYFYRMWNTDNPQAHTENFETLYQSVPFLIAQRDETAYGIFLDNSFETYFDMGKEDAESFSFGAKDGDEEYYFIYGPSIKEVVGGYTALTGRVPLPQLWTLGYQQCRWSYAPKERFLEIARAFREKRIPCDTLYLDIDYMDGYRVFTYDKERFAGFGEMVAKLRGEGYKVVTIIDPGVKKDAGYAVYDEGLQNGYFITDPDGVPYVNAVWPGDALYPDFSNNKVRAWWADKQRFLIENGVAGVWNDMNEPASFNGPLPENLLFDNDGFRTTHAEMHNVYGHYMSKAAYEGFLKHSGKRPFVITRACYAGTQKYSTVWTGDNQSLWEHLRMSLPQLMNMGLSGFAFAGCDVGGFGFDCSPELLCRWVQVGFLTPLFRNHAAYGTRSQEPWAFDAQTETINRKYIELRYTLLPYLYDVLRETEHTGLPVMRPLVLEFQNDPAVGEINDEFLCGSSLLAAPVVQQGQRARAVYLPAGADWVDFWTHEIYSGGQWVLREAPLDVCPLYVRQGVVLPRWPVMQYVGEQPVEEPVFEVYLPAPGESLSYAHYTDDGETFAYRDGAYNQYALTLTPEAGGALLRLQKTHAGWADTYRAARIRLIGGAVSAVLCDDAPAAREADGSFRLPGCAGTLRLRW